LSTAAALATDALDRRWHDPFAGGENKPAHGQSSQAAAGGVDSGRGGDVDAYRTLLTKVYALSTGTLDQMAFEYECRRLLGINGYVMFTMDKLLQAATRHLQMLLNDDVASRLLAVHAWEATRTRGPVEMTYYADVRELLGDDDAYRIAFDPVSGALAFHLLGADVVPPPRFADAQLDQWSVVSRNFVPAAEGADGGGARQHRVFLARTRRRAAHGAASSAVSANNASTSVVSTLIAALPPLSSAATILAPTPVFVVSNGLGCRICLSTSRLHYVDGTEDVFCRLNAKHHSVPATLAARRAKGPKLEEIAAKLTRN